MIMKEGIRFVSIQFDLYKNVKLLRRLIWLQRNHVRSQLCLHVRRRNMHQSVCRRGLPIKLGSAVVTEECRILFIVYAIYIYAVVQIKIFLHILCLLILHSIAEQ